METIHSFFRPLILEAILRRDDFVGTASVEQDQKKRLIDRLVEATDGKPFYLRIRRNVDFGQI